MLLNLGLFGISGIQTGGPWLLVLVMSRAGEARSSQHQATNPGEEVRHGMEGFQPIWAERKPVQPSGSRGQCLPDFSGLSPLL